MRVAVAVLRGTRGDIEPALRAALRAVEAVEADVGPTVLRMVTHAEHDWLVARICEENGSTRWQAVWLSSAAISPRTALSDDQWRLRADLDRDVIARACGPPAPTVVLPNLFALEAVHCAEAVGAPCVVLAPYRPVCADPKQRRLLCRRVTRAASLCFPGRDAAAAAPQAALEEWLAPAADDARFGEWRMTRLGLPPLPEWVAAWRGGDRPSLLYGASPTMREAAPPQDSGAAVVGQWLAPPWPWDGGTPPALQDWLALESTPVVMLAMGAAWTAIAASPALDRLLGGTRAACAMARRRLLVVASAAAAPRVTEAWASLRASNEGGAPEGPLLAIGPSAALWRDPSGLPFPALLPRCEAVVHHGGGGTSAEASRAGVPQVIIPCFADQPARADTLAGLGVAAVVPWSDIAACASSRAVLQRMAAALAAARKPAAVAAAAELGAQMRAEPCGLAAAAAAVRHTVHAWPRRRRQGGAAAARGAACLAWLQASQRSAAVHFPSPAASLRLHVPRAAAAEGAHMVQEATPGGVYGRHGVGAALAASAAAPEPALLVDVGANAGAFLLACLAHGAGAPRRVVAVEPLPRAAALWLRTAVEAGWQRLPECDDHLLPRPPSPDAAAPTLPPDDVRAAASRATGCDDWVRCGAAGTVLALRGPGRDCFAALVVAAAADVAAPGTQAMLEYGEMPGNSTMCPAAKAPQAAWMARRDGAGAARAHACRVATVAACPLRDAVAAGARVMRRAADADAGSGRESRKRGRPKEGGEGQGTPPVAVLKVDVEGAEVAVLRAAAGDGTLARAGMVVAEAHAESTLVPALTTLLGADFAVRWARPEGPERGTGAFMLYAQPLPVR